MKIDLFTTYGEGTDKEQKQQCLYFEKDEEGIENHVVILLNRSRESVPVVLRIGEKVAKFITEPESIVTGVIPHASVFD